MKLVVELLTSKNENALLSDVLNLSIAFNILCAVFLIELKCSFLIADVND